MKKILFFVSAVVIVGSCLALAQHIPGQGGPVDPNATVSLVGVKYCEDHPEMISCSDPKFMQYGINGAEVECCVERKGIKGGRGSSSSKGTLYCEDFLKYGYDDYGYHKLEGIVPCESPAWDHVSRCCVFGKPDKGDKGKPNKNKPAQQVKNERPQQAVIMMSTNTGYSSSTGLSTRTVK